MCEGVGSPTFFITARQNFGFFLIIFHFKGEKIIKNIVSANLAELGENRGEGVSAQRWKKPPFLF